MTDDEATRAMVRRIWDELSIRKTIARLARAQDDLDRDAYKTCFTDRVMLTEAAVVADWTPKEISVDELAEMYFSQIEKLEFGHHLVFNHVIDVDGDEATCLADLFAVSARQDGGDTKNSMSGGRYSLKLRRVGEQWLIYERAVTMRYRLAPLSDVR